jgi:hypothetical protein
VGEGLSSAVTVPSQAETLRSIYAVWRLLRADRSAVALLDDSPEGFVKSFFAAVLVLPLWVLHEWMQLSDEQIAPGALGLVAIEGLTYAISWMAFPVAMIFVSEAMNRGLHYYRHIVAWNWAVVIQAIFVVPLAVIATEVEALTGLLLFAQIAIFLYQWYVTRTTLEIDAFPAIGVVFVGWTLDLLIAGIGKSMVVG